MATTSLKLPDDIKQRVVRSSQKQGISPHAFMIKAIGQAVTASERQARFLDEAKASREEALSTGKGYDANEVHEYIHTRIEQGNAARPSVKRWQK